VPSTGLLQFSTGVWKSLNRVMSTLCGKRKLRERHYQIRKFPATAARDIRRATLRIEDSLVGTDGSATVYPFWGSFKSLRRKICLNLARADCRAQLWAAALYAWAIAALFGLRAHHHLPPWWALMGLAALAIVAERSSVRLTGHIESSISFLPFVFTAVVFGPLAALVVGAVGNLGILRPPYLRWVVYTPARALTGAAAGLAAWVVAPGGARTFASIFVATFAAAGANLIVDLLLNFGTMRVRGAGSVRNFFRSAGPLLAVSLPLYVPLVALLVYGYRIYSLWVVAFFILSALALQRLMQLYQEQREAVRRFAEANEQLERANLSFASALVATLDARDQYTAGHSAAVAMYARDIAKRMGLSDDEQHLAHLCGLVHDIGKVGLPAGLLEKPGPLTLDERRQMEQHAAIGERILRNVDTYSEIASVVRHHHERVDGEGYPDGLRSAETPLLSRIIAVADAYDAMTSDRPYRDAMPSPVARLRLAQAVESQFDTSVVAAFEAILARAPESYRAGMRQASSDAPADVDISEVA
jgi:putative nucleotidyltransferase with HDIG domain